MQENGFRNSLKSVCLLLVVPFLIIKAGGWGRAGVLIVGVTP
jgi:hypothetical protein